jgi:hypothetical protein
VPTKKVILFLALCSGVAFLAGDYATYDTMVIEENGDSAKLSELISFGQYMEFRLEKSSYKFKSSSEFEVGGLVTKLFYLLNLLGSALGAFGVLWLCKEKYPFCERCDRFYAQIFSDKKRIGTEAAFKGHYAELRGPIDSRDGLALRGAWDKIPAKPAEKRAPFLVVLEARKCPTCMKSSIRLTPSMLSGNNWSELKDLSIFVNTEAPLLQKNG